MSNANPGQHLVCVASVRGWGTWILSSSPGFYARGGTLPPTYLGKPPKQVRCVDVWLTKKEVHYRFLLNLLNGGNGHELEKSQNLPELGIQVGRDFFRTSQHSSQSATPSPGHKTDFDWGDQRKLRERTNSKTMRMILTGAGGAVVGVEKRILEVTAWVKAQRKNQVNKIGKTYLTSRNLLFNSISAPQRLSIRTAVTQQPLKAWTKGKHSHTHSALEIEAKETQKYWGHYGSLSWGFLWNKELCGFLKASFLLLLLHCSVNREHSRSGQREEKRASSHLQPEPASSSSAPTRHALPRKSGDNKSCL